MGCEAQGHLVSIVLTRSEAVFACHSAACAPPPAGAGGSLPGPSGARRPGPDVRRLGQPHAIPVEGSPGQYHVYTEHGHYKGQSGTEQANRYVTRRKAQLKGTATKRKNAAEAEAAAMRGPHKVITRDEARGDSRPVSAVEFQFMAKVGQGQLDKMKANASPTTGLDQNWSKIKSESYDEVRKPWGGATIDAHTGEALPQGVNKYAITVKDRGVETVSVRENPTPAEWESAMNEARQRFGPILEREGHHLGVFHDDDSGCIDIDPVLVVSSSRDVETIGAASHAIGGAYNFQDGNGYFPPHVGPGTARLKDGYKRTYEQP